METRYKKIKKNWYNVVVKPLKMKENKPNNHLIQYIVKYEGIYLIGSTREMSLEEINNIDLKEYKFRTLRETKVNV